MLPKGLAGSTPAAGAVLKRSRLLMVAGLVLLVGVIVPARAVLAGSELSPSVYGFSCIGYSSDMVTIATAYTIPTTQAFPMHFEVRCSSYITASATSGQKTAFDTFINRLADGTLCDTSAACSALSFNVGYRRVSDNSARSAGASCEDWIVEGNGDLYNSAGAVVKAADPGGSPDGYFRLSGRCWAGSAQSPGLDFRVAISLPSGSPTLAQGDWLPCTPTQSAVPSVQVCHAYDDLVDWTNGQIWPDYWPGGAGPDLPCEGVEVEWRQNGDLLTYPLSGTGERGDNMTVRLIFPDTGATHTDAEIILMPQLDDPAGRRTLGTFTYPDDGLTMRQFNVTASFMELSTPTFDLSLIRLRCSDNNGVIYFTGATGDFGDGTTDPLEGQQLPPSEAACYSSALDGMSLDSPVTWVTGIGRMAVCLVEWLFVPDGEAVSESFDAFTLELAEQLPFSLIYSLIDFGANFYDAASDSAATGCMDMGGDWSFGAYGDVAVPDVCVGESLDVSVGQRQTLVYLMLGGLWFAVARHALGLVRGSGMMVTR